MRTIAHISDLHFGQIEPATLPALTAALHAEKPDVLAVSGDLTQRARKHEFIAARQFLDDLPGAPIIVPGNHDVPLFNVLSRWLSPLDNYRRYICNDLQPFFADQEIAVLGVNTARSLTLKDGRINRQQVESSCEKLRGCKHGVMRVIVAHHPFDATEAQAGAIVGRADMAMEQFAGCKVDIILTGHLHMSSARESSVRYKNLGHSTLIVQAGTATSKRTRGAPNMWNLIRIDQGKITLDSWGWLPREERFSVFSTDVFHRSPNGWTKLPN